jgi:hypothetical protein
LLHGLVSECIEALLWGVPVEGFAGSFVEFSFYFGEEIAKAKASAVTESKAQSARLMKLKNERENLLKGYYAGAVPLELMKTEQTRITAEVDHAEARSKALDASFQTVEHNLDRAMDFAANWHHALPGVRRPGTT